MNPFREATYDQLARLLSIIDAAEQREIRNGHPCGISLDFFNAWADGSEDEKITDLHHPTEDVILKWEQTFDI